MSAVRDAVYATLRYRGVRPPVPDDLNLRTSGIIDSLGLLRFVLDLETMIGKVIPDEVVGRPEFQVVGTMIKILEELP